MVKQLFILVIFSVASLGNCFGATTAPTTPVTQAPVQETQEKTLSPEEKKKHQDAQKELDSFFKDLEKQIKQLEDEAKQVEAAKKQKKEAKADNNKQEDVQKSDIKDVTPVTTDNVTEKKS